MKIKNSSTRHKRKHRGMEVTREDQNRALRQCLNIHLLVSQFLTTSEDLVSLNKRVAKWVRERNT